MASRMLQPSLMRQIVFLISLMLVTLLAAFVVTDRVAKQIIERKVTDTVDKIFLQVQEKMSSFHSDMQGISTFLFYSPTVQNYINSEDSLSRVLMNGELLSMFANTSSMKANIRGIELFDQSGKLLARVGEGEDEWTDSVPKLAYSGRIDLKNRPTERFYKIATPVYGLDSNHIATEFKGTGVYVMDANNFIPILRSAKITSGSRVMLLDGEDRTIASEGVVSDEDVIRVETWKNDPRYIVQSVTLPDSGWKLISVIPKGELLAELDSMQRINVATYVTMFVLLCLFLLIFFTRILRPIRSLMEFIRSYPKNGEDSRYEVIHRNEIGVLGAKLNKMLDDIGALSSEVQSTQTRMYEMELAKKQMEISAFRNQINPHFLYNTLESIRAMALYYNVQDIADLSESLSRMFRYAVKGSNFVAVADELSHVREYARIIDFRFRGRFRILIDCEPELLEATMLKMLLQPLVENAVFHGLERKLGNGRVAIDIRRAPSGDIQLSIEDDGRGMSGERLEELLRQLDNFEEKEDQSGASRGIGVLNIYRRIRLFYGTEAQMGIESLPDQGTLVRITWPARPMAQKEEMDDVQSADRR
ncbi:cache domain-containing sensor histidine kinase [Cohnella fermenti]|nr:sensor histidine kinase [Cohnella fermenti]